jgi:hypothetical protein
MEGIFEMVTPSPSRVEMVTPPIDLCDEAMEGIVEMVTPSPSRVEMITPPIDLCDEAQVDTGRGKLNNGTSDGNVVRRELSIRLFDDQSTSVDLVSKPTRVLVTRSLPFSGSTPSKWLTVFRKFTQWIAFRVSSRPVPQSFCS